MLRTRFISYTGSRVLLGQQCPLPFSPPHAAAWQRPYATAHSDFPDTKDLSWPSSETFTPYDVFNQARTAPYSKHRFYELVKIYHPDRPCNNHPLCKDITPEVRLQRYHIVVTAHEILSDPNRRAAYDATGMGWQFNPATRHRRGSASTAEPDPIFANATWEDWERWYNRHGKRQENLVDQKTFVTFVVLLFFLGAAVQASWFTQVNTGYEDRLKDLNEQSMRFLNERRKNTVNQMVGGEAKVQHFLIRRDPSGFGLKGGEQGVYRETLAPLPQEGSQQSQRPPKASRSSQTIQTLSNPSQDQASSIESRPPSDQSRRTEPGHAP
ncbi:hypothetical protein BDV06DRAFT_12363 [Aspergillus oleicola]